MSDLTFLISRQRQRSPNITLKPRGRYTRGSFWGGRRRNNIDQLKPPDVYEGGGGGGGDDVTSS